MPTRSLAVTLVDLLDKKVKIKDVTGYGQIAGTTHNIVMIWEDR